MIRKTRCKRGWFRLDVKSVAQLRALLFEMEKSLGLAELSQNEKDVLYAINQLAKSDANLVKSDQIRSHPLVSEFPSASFHRALKSLLKRGLVSHAPETKARSYIVNAELQV